MKLFYVKHHHHLNWLAWVLLPLLLLGTFMAGSFTLFSTYAAPAPNASLDGSYALRATTTAGPQKNLYITGILGLSVAGTTLSGIARGLSYAHSSDYAK